MHANHHAITVENLDILVCSKLMADLEKKLKRVTVSLARLQLTSTSLVLMSRLASSRISDICKQDELQKEREISASKVMHVCGLVNEGDADRQLLWLIVLVDQNRCNTPIATMVLVDSFCENMQHTEEHLQSVLR